MNIGNRTALDVLIEPKWSNKHIDFSQNTCFKMGVMILKICCNYCVDRPYPAFALELFYYFQEVTSNRKTFLTKLLTD